jgi:hypothetical protein
MPNRYNAMTGSGLLNEVIESHGGLNQWNSYQTLSCKAKMGGLTWSLKGQEGVLSDVYGTAQLHRQSFSWHSVFPEGLRSEFAPERVALIGKDNAVVEELQHPRDSFKGHLLATPLDEAAAHLLQQLCHLGIPDCTFSLSNARHSGI